MFSKGVSGNPNGRPKGSGNESTKQVREAVALIVNNNLEQLQADLESLTPSQRIKAIIALMEYVTPKLNRISSEMAVDQSPVIIKFVEARSYTCEACGSQNNPPDNDEGNHIPG